MCGRRRAYTDRYRRRTNIIFYLYSARRRLRTLARVYRFVRILSFLSFRDVFMSFRWEIMHASCTRPCERSDRFVGASDASVCGGKIMLYYCRNMLFTSIRWRFVSAESSFRCLPGPWDSSEWCIDLFPPNLIHFIVFLLASPLSNAKLQFTPRAWRNPLFFKETPIRRHSYSFWFRLSIKSARRWFHLIIPVIPSAVNDAGRIPNEFAFALSECC